MKLEDQVTSLKLAKKLKELGVKQKSYFYWWGQDLAHTMYFAGGGLVGSKPIEKVSAFTVAELGEILPEYIVADNEGRFLKITKSTRKTIEWDIGYTDSRHSGFWGFQNAKKETDARAKMLIYLLKNKLINPTPNAK